MTTIKNFFNIVLTKQSNVFIIGTARADVAELADALDLGSSGRPWGFKSLHPHQKKSFTIVKLFFYAVILFGLKLTHFGI